MLVFISFHKAYTLQQSRDNENEGVFIHPAQNTTKFSYIARKYDKGKMTTFQIRHN